METATDSDILQDSSGVGQKAVRLAELRAKGFSVPPFRVLRGHVVDAIASGAHADTSELTDGLSGAKFAVRSAALSEDSESDSQAGRFVTVLNVDRDQISQAVQEVIEDARGKGMIGEGKFSIVIQAYVEAEYAGVVFTRNPIEGREMVVEWRRGRGAEVVGGLDVSRESVIPGNDSIREPFRRFRELCDAATKIETLYGAPQDIEWVITLDTIYIVQTRPITSISKSRYEGYLFAEKHLPDGDFYFDQRSLGEAFLRAKPLSLDILRSLTTNGAVARTYSKLGIPAGHSDVYRVIGNSVYIDMQKQLTELFPAYSYFGGNDLSPRFRYWRGIVRTIRAMFGTGSIPKPDMGKLRTSLRETMLEFAESDGLDVWDTAWQRFDNAYERVYSVNIYAERSMQTLRMAAARYDIAAEQLLLAGNGAYDKPALDKKVIDALSGITGNSIDIADESTFVGNILDGRESSVPDDRIWNGLSKSAQLVLAPLIQSARELLALREEGRWLGVLATANLRRSLFAEAKRAGIEEFSLMYFARLDEVARSVIDVSKLRTRKAEYEAFDTYEMPSVLSSIAPPLTEDSYGVSPGLAEGLLCTEATLVPGGILLVDRLTPDLTRHFEEISGILSREGGVLSHLAIVARERGLPVVVDRRTVNYGVGSVVSIDGTTGSVTVLGEMKETGL